MTLEVASLRQKISSPVKIELENAKPTTEDAFYLYDNDFDNEKEVYMSPTKKRKGNNSLIQDIELDPLDRAIRVLFQKEDKEQSISRRTDNLNFEGKGGLVSTN